MRRKKLMADNKLKTLGKCLTLAILGAALAVPALPSSALAKDQKRDRKRDGSCKNLVVPAPAAEYILVKDQKRDRKRDGSCASLMVPSPTAEKSLAKDQKRDRKRDGSC